jgi:uncharacterized membrane protein
MKALRKSEMKRWIVVFLSLLLAIAAMFSTAPRKARAASLTFTTIDFPGAVASLGTDINDFGQIVGEYTFSGLGDRQGFLLSKGAFTSISYPGATFTRAVGINRYGDIVGDHQKAGNNNGSGNDYGYLLRGGVFTSIVFPNSDSTIPAGINANDDIVGWYLDKTGTHGFLLRAGTYTSIDFPGAAADTEAWKINDYGEIAGRYTGSTDGKHHMFIFSNATFTAVPDVPNSNETAVVEDGGLNNLGHIVSQYHSSKSCALFTSVGCLHGFLLRGGVYTTIDFPNSTETLALGVNSSDDVVGGYEDSSGKFHAYLRTP